MTSETALCDLRSRHAGSSWIAIDFDRLDDPSMLGPTTNTIKLGSSEEHLDGANGVLLLYVSVQPASSPDVKSQ